MGLGLLNQVTWVTPASNFSPKIASLKCTSLPWPGVEALNDTHYSSLDVISVYIMYAGQGYTQKNLIKEL